MGATLTIGTNCDELLALVDELDELEYAPGMDQRDHALQTAALALADDADDDLVVAALLHDVGRSRYLARQAPGVPHEEVGRRFVEERFSDRAAALVALHVPAKRYLLTVEEDYRSRLSRASRLSLKRQGGTLSARQLAAFEAEPLAADAIRLRRWDDAAQLADGPSVDLGRLRVVLDRAWR